MNGWKLAVSVLIASLAAAVARAESPATLSISLHPSLPPPALVGAMVTWTAAVSHPRPESLWYRFRVRGLDEDFRTIVDYGPSQSLQWTVADHEGVYEIEVSVRDRETGESATASAFYEMRPRVSGEMPVVSPTAHPLVWLYSAPACPEGSRMKVEARSADGYAQGTPYKDCRPGLSMNYYLAGMRPETHYAIWHIVDTGLELEAGPELRLTTAAAPAKFAGRAATSQAAHAEGFLLHCPLNATPTITDLAGNVVWFYPGYVSKLTRPAPGGLFYGIMEDYTEDQSYQIVREFDLLGMTLRETNAARVNEQLIQMGKRPISSFHHEAGPLPDGKLLVLATVEQILTDVQGPGPVNVLGDMIIVLDRDLEVVWTWDAFDHLDPRRAAVLGETCAPGSGGCSAFYLSARANDWLHGNSVTRTPDGDLLFSIRHQDWVIKIDYQDGNGSGRVLWRLGKDGDFLFDTADPYPWFSHQHDAEFEWSDGSILTVFDNGNTRRLSNSAATSRGQAIQLDEQNRVARFVLNAELLAYAPALGSAQRLPNGNYQFELGILPPENSSLSVEVDPSGYVVYAFRSPEPRYRSFRMQDLYTPF